METDEDQNSAQLCQNRDLMQCLLVVGWLGDGIFLKVENEVRTFKLLGILKVLSILISIYLLC